ncbi:MAG: ATP-binding protein [Lachnospiraceae bacterium]
MQAFADIPRIYTALAEWSACLIYISMMEKRLKGIKLAGIAFAALVFQSVFLVLTDGINIVFWIPCMILAILLMYLFLYICGERSKINAGFWCVKAFVLAEFAAAAEWHIYSFFWTENDARSWVKLLLLVIIYGVIFGLAWLLEKRFYPVHLQIQINKKELLSAIIIGIAVFTISNISFISSNTPFSGRYSYEIRLMRMLIDLGGLVILYAQSIQISELRARRELEAMNNDLYSQYQQYQQMKESIEMINQKQHDFKHQIGLLRIMDSDEKRNAYLDEIEKDIGFHEIQNKTGNHVLDTILAGKSLYCSRNNIKFTYVADGKLLSFMSTMDICSIFGNVLDNAIEGEKKISDDKKRLIHLTVSGQKGFLLIKVENYFDGEIVFEGDIPKTNKKDKRNHGYGIKSISHVAGKYNGTMTISTGNKWFEVKILIPLPE